jgi:hypothetical protein
LRLEGAVATTTVHGNYPTGLHVPKSIADGSAVLALLDVLEIGGRMSYGPYSQDGPTSQNAVPPIPSREGTFGIGPEIRGTVRFGRSGDFALGLAGNVLEYRIPYANWVRDDTCSLGPTCVDALSELDLLGAPAGVLRYRLQNSGTAHREVFNVALFASQQIAHGQGGHLFAAVGAHTGFENDGFTDDPSLPAFKTAASVYVLGLGYGIRACPLRGSTSLAFPLTNSDSAIAYDQPQFGLTVGVDIPLWGSCRDGEGVQLFGSPTAPARPGTPRSGTGAATP